DAGHQAGGDPVGVLPEGEHDFLKQGNAVLLGNVGEGRRGGRAGGVGRRAVVGRGSGGGGGHGEARPAVSGKEKTGVIPAGEDDGLGRVAPTWRWGGNVTVPRRPSGQGGALSGV